MAEKHPPDYTSQKIAFVLSAAGRISEHRRLIIESIRTLCQAGWPDVVKARNSIRAMIEDYRAVRGACYEADHQVEGLLHELCRLHPDLSQLDERVTLMRTMDSEIADTADYWAAKVRDLRKK
jgi:predicted nuclease with TOPRIM domain